MGRDFQIIRIDPVTRIVSIEMPTPPREIDGVFALVQWICLELYQEAGTQILDIEAGASLERFLGLLSEDQITGVRMDLAVVFGQVEDRIRARQATQTLSSNERLREMILENVEFSTVGQEIKVLIRVVAESGRATRIDVGSVVFANEEAA